MILTVMPFIFIFGLIIGSFLNCLIWRLHTGESLNGRSYCPKCRKRICWFDNIPVVSFILLRGKCRHCGKPISWQYPLVELITGLLFFFAFCVNFHFSPFNAGQAIPDIYAISRFPIVDFIRLLRDWFIIAVMIVIFIIDLRWYLILDAVTLPSAVLIFFLNILLGMNWHNLLFSGIIGGSFFLFQFLVSGGKWIGGGDIRLGLLMGLAFGWPLTLLAIIMGYWIGTIVAVYLMISGKKQLSSKLPLGVFLSLSSVIVLFWGEYILRSYFNIFL